MQVSIYDRATYTLLGVYEAEIKNDIITVPITKITTLTYSKFGDGSKTSNNRWFISANIDIHNDETFVLVVTPDSREKILGKYPAIKSTREHYKMVSNWDQMIGVAKEYREKGYHLLSSDISDSHGEITALEHAIHDIGSAQWNERVRLNYSRLRGSMQNDFATEKNRRAMQKKEALDVIKNINQLIEKYPELEDELREKLRRKNSNT